MKKKGASSIVCFFIILICVCAVFFIGWSQFKIETGSVGVVVSKLAGISSKPIIPGKFSWHWEFLIPKNAKIITFKTEPISFSQKVSGILPSGEVYSKAYKNQPDFSYNFEFEISAFLNPEDYIELMKNSSISNQETLEKYLKNSAYEIAGKAVLYFLEKAKSEKLFSPQTIGTEEILFTTDANTIFKNIHFQNFSVTVATFPDFALYESARMLYLSGTEEKDVSAESDKNSIENKTSSQKKSEDESEKLLNKIKQLIGKTTTQKIVFFI